MLDGAHEKHAATERITKIGGQFLLARHIEDVVDAGRNIVLTHFIPSINDDEKNKTNLGMDPN